jgi:hypothetical protein
MKTKLLFSTETQDYEVWKDLPALPRIDEFFNVRDMLKTEELAVIKQSAQCWSGTRGIVQSVEYRYNTDGFYTEIFIWCED